MRGWTKQLYEVLSSDQEFKKRREMKELEDAKVDGNGEVSLKIEQSINQRYLNRNSEKYAYLRNFGLVQIPEKLMQITVLSGTPYEISISLICFEVRT